MRTLLIDNYDSFTYNLYQLISEVNGVEPVVIRNDEVRDPADLDLDAFDNVVISPGPGRPDVMRDFGVSAAVIAHSRLPLLGVCLGHQGIVLAAGGVVGAAPEARHGYPDRITHDGRDLFAGLPQDFTAVRYHSLSATLPLPEALEVTATAPDGVVMGVRHRTRPQWGVQFHPESIASEHGSTLLRNFRDLTAEFAPTRRAARRHDGHDGHDGHDENPPRAADTANVPDPTPARTDQVMTGRGPEVSNSEACPESQRALSPDTGPDRPASIGSDHERITEDGDAASNSAADSQHRRAPSPDIDVGAAASTGRDRATGPDVEAAHTVSIGVTGAGMPAEIRYTVEHTVVERAVDAEEVFLRLYRDSPTAFWLDSEHVEPGLDRFSFLGDASGPLAETVRYRVGSGSVEVESAAGARSVPGGVLEYLSGELRRRRIEFPDVPFDFVGGYVGYLGYEMKADCGAAVTHRAPTPDAQWIFADRLIVVDHEAGRTHLMSLAETDPNSLRAAKVWLSATRALVDTVPTWENPPPLELRTDERTVAPLLTRGRDRYLADVRASQDQLHAGESYEICITDSAYLPAASDGLDVYRTLRRCNPAPYAAFLRFTDLEVACSSPERFLKLDRARTVESKPIKGTAPRGRTPIEDERLASELARSPKTRAENLMIVDLLRNDLGRVCEIGTVHVPELMAVETYTTLHQLVSTVRGTLRPELDVIDCLRACFPGGSMTGAPKLRSMEIIDTLETEARGIYSGAIGFLGLGGTADLNIVIRTAVRHENRWRIGAGGAVVLDSDPDEEYQEMVWKAAATLRALPGLAVPETAPLPSA
ncbi:aminodeoxychorismate synthase component I [Nocardia jejuensis]|uniref:aminodeoxychorismate synthase component I n=1 Tax=Nocardia jejuensis TaxID=328049 RepID=UPI00082FE92F|nr:aminodeoxychorismate synthase component I [Nocardia jejuensis]